MLEPTFFADVIKYLGDKEVIVKSQESKKGLFSSEIEKTKKQLQNIKKILKELYEKRESKIIELALFSSRIGKKEENLSAMMLEEAKMYNQLYNNLVSFRQGILENIMNKQLPKISMVKPKGLKSEKKEEKILLRIIHAIPKFVGPNMEIYGPFDEEDMVFLDKNIANTLINKRRAEKIKDENTQINEKVLQEM